MFALKGYSELSQDTLPSIVQRSFFVHYYPARTLFNYSDNTYELYKRGMFILFQDCGTPKSAKPRVGTAVFR